MKQVSASPAGAAPAAFCRRRSSLLLATASAIALLSEVPHAAALTCGGAPPAGVATPAALYETLRDRTDAQLLAIGFAQQPADCTWVYEVKMLTTSGSVVELDFDAKELDLIGARGPDNDKEVARLVRGLGGNVSTIDTRGARNANGPAASGGEAADDGGSAGGSSGPGGGGSSGPASSGSSGPSSGGEDGEGSDGGEGGNSGSGEGGEGDGGEGSEGGEGDGGDDGGGDDGGGEGSEGGGGEGGEGEGGGDD